MSATFDVQNPATGARVRSVPNAGADEARVMAGHAVAAFPGWRDTTAYARSAILRQWFNLMIQDEDTLA
ncbi:MAG: aldehyde dehydrogenase family protein, partial [Acidobacteriota bacterium]